MRISLILLIQCLLVLAPGQLQAHTEPPVYIAEFEKGNDGEPFLQFGEQLVQGQTQRLVTVRFRVRRLDGQMPEPGDRIEIQEDGVTVARLELTQPQTQAMAAVLCLDISGSMANANKLDQARVAALAFVNRLAPTVHLGLLLFDDKVLDNDPSRCVPLTTNPAQVVSLRQKMRELIQAAQPSGGTAYLDAIDRALVLLGPGDKLQRKAIVVMTDGADLASQVTLDEVVTRARRANVPLYTIGIGQAGNREVVNTVLVLDRSGSMKGKASDADAKTKLEALHEAACRFVDLTRPNARTALLPFSTVVSPPRVPVSDRPSLKRRIREITADGGTRLYDAILEGIDAVATTSTSAGGKRVVVVLTDGKDESPGSRASPVEIVRRAKEENVTLFTLGLGREHEIQRGILEQMARDTGGQFYHASNQQRLLEVFEKLSLDIYDDGIDEESLRKLADATGGRYYHIKEADRLEMLFPRLAQELQETYTLTFPSRRQLHDGTARGITLSVVRGSEASRRGERLSNVAETTYAVRGLIVVPEIGPGVYLSLLGVLLVLLALPSVWRRTES